MPYTPDPRPRVERATRFFARLLSFDLECPRCGKVYQIRATNQRGKYQRVGETTSGKGLRVDAWDPVTSRFTCTNLPHCDSRVYILGLLAWPVGKGKVAQGTPKDQIPHPRQLAQMRKEGGGWWMAEEDRITTPRTLETNLTLDAERPEEHADDDDEIA
jgi:hypothetical protein